MTVGQIGVVCGRKAQIVAIHDRCLRVLYLEPSERGKTLDIPFVPFEINVPKDNWYLGEENW